MYLAKIINDRKQRIEDPRRREKFTITNRRKLSILMKQIDSLIDNRVSREDQNKDFFKLFSVLISIRVILIKLYEIKNSKFSESHRNILEKIKKIETNYSRDPNEIDIVSERITNTYSDYVRLQIDKKYESHIGQWKELNSMDLKDVLQIRATKEIILDLIKFYDEQRHKKNIELSDAQRLENAIRSMWLEDDANALTYNRLFREESNKPSHAYERYVDDATPIGQPRRTLQY